MVDEKKTYVRVLSSIINSSDCSILLRCDEIGEISGSIACFGCGVFPERGVEWKGQPKLCQGTK